MKAERCLALIACMLLAGCGGAEPPEERAPETPRDSSAFDALTGTIDRAERVQETIDDRAAELRRRIDETED